MPRFYLTPKQDDFNQKLQVCIAEALYDVDSIVGAIRWERGSTPVYHDADLTGGSATVQQTRMRAST